MKFVLILVPAIVAFIFGKMKSKYRIHVTATFVVYVILMNAIYNYRIIPSIMLFTRPTNQVIYQEEYAGLQEFPDALLQLVIDGKKIYTKNDPWFVEEAMNAGYDWLYAYYHMVNPVLYLEHYGAEVTCDSKLNNSVIDDALQNDFDHIGYANDMLRNVCMYYTDTTDVSNYFFHQYYYADYLDGIKIYVNFDNLADSDELVLLWQNVENNELEEFYLMTKDYYDRNVK